MADAVAPLSAREAHAPHWAERLVRVLDDVLKLPGGFGVGLDALVGLVLPGAGDVLTALSGLALFLVAHRENVPKRVLARMVLNVAVDLGLGVVPVVGDAFDFVWKSNRKNLELIERHRREPGQRSAGDVAVLVLAVALLLVSLIVPLVALGYTLRWLGGALHGVVS